jgi:hypothetical protein
VSAAEAARAQLTAVTHRAVREAAKCGHRGTPCVFCHGQADLGRDAAEAYASAVAAKMLDDYRAGQPARDDAERSFAERLAAAAGPAIRLSKPSRTP